MSVTLIIILAAIVLCIVLSSVFSASEMAYSSCNTVRLQNLADDKNRKAARALRITNDYDKALSAILIGNNLVNIASSSLGTVAVALVFGDTAHSWISTVAITALVIIFGETIPKITTKKTATKTAMANGWFIRTLMYVFCPVTAVVVFLVNLISRLFKGEKADEQQDSEESVEELQSIIETAEDEGVLDKDQTELVQAAIDFSEVSAAEVMTARIDMLTINIEDTPYEILATAEESRFSRIPVYEDTRDNIIGVLHLNRYFSAVAAHKGADVDIKPLLNETCYVYKTMKLPDVLTTLKKAKQHLAIVTDEYGGTLGLVTLEDVMEQIVGEIWDENDTVEEDIVQKNDTEFDVDGDLPIAEFLELVGIDEDSFEAESETVGGWAIELAGTFPDVGQVLVYGNIEMKVVDMDERRVQKLSVRILPKED